MNDFETLVEEFRGKLPTPFIQETLKIMLEKKNEMQMTIYGVTYTAFVVVAGLVYGYISGQKSTDPLLYVYLAGGFIVLLFVTFEVRNLYKRRGEIKPELFREYLNALIKLEEKTS